MAELQKTMYIVFHKPLRPWSELLPVLPEHLNFIIDLESKGLLFASGPFKAEEQLEEGYGMTILRTGSREEAAAIMREEPFVKRGLRGFEIRSWQLNEGSYTVTVRYSNQSARIE